MPTPTAAQIETLYLELAARARANAAKHTFDKTKETFLRLAETYEKQAQKKHEIAAQLAKSPLLGPRAE